MSMDLHAWPYFERISSNGNLQRIYQVFGSFPVKNKHCIWVYIWVIYIMFINNMKSPMKNRVQIQNGK